jgi:uncharacterized protein (DUF1501 family)
MARTNPYRACEDFHRTAASARHPTVGVTRRHFLGLGAGAGLALYTARALPLAHWLDGAQEAAAQAPDARILVSVFLPGGLDLLDSFLDTDQLGHYTDTRAGAARTPAEDQLPGTSLSAHPALGRGSLGGIKGLFAAGRVALLPGIDYTNPDLSHFHSRRFWETGTITAQQTTGWLGRWLDLYGGSRNPFQGVTSGARLSPTLLTNSAPICSISGLSRASMRYPGVSRSRQDLAAAAYRELMAGARGDGPGRQAVRLAGRRAESVSRRLLQVDDVGTPVLPPSDPLYDPEGLVSGYPARSQFGARLQQLATLLSQPLGIRIATVDCLGDFDTHNNQPDRLMRTLTDVSASLAAFQCDVELRGLGDRVLTFVWTEFGRRLRSNRSAGTDHGAGGIAWLMGTRVPPGGLLTEYPSLQSLDQHGNLKVTADFRGVYASLIEQWLGTSAEGIIPDAGAFGRVAVAV